MAATGLSSDTTALELRRPTSAPRVGSMWAGKLQPFLPWAICIGLTAFAYGGSLRAGIMFDAALDLPRATARGWLDVLTNAGASPYFRPVTLLLWKTSYELLGRNDFALLHGLVLASHTICGWLVYQLGRRLLGFWTGLLGAALFLWFPLSYQVVGFVDSQFHSLALLFVLAAVVLYWDARVTRSRWRLSGSVACAGIAMLTHESTAALVAPAILGLELLLVCHSERRAKNLPALGAGGAHSALGSRHSALSPWPALFAVETLVYGVIWLLVPRWPTTLHLDPASIQLNGVYFIQALGYPLTMQLGHWPRLGNDVLEVLLASGGVATVLLGLAAARHTMAVSLFGLGWFALALLPAWLLLPWPNYVIDAPRLLYAASAGIALLWAAALAPSRITPPGVMAGAAALAVLAVSINFVAFRERLLDRGASVVSQLVDTATRSGAQAGRVYVNVPAFVGPQQADFLLGHSGVTMLPDYFGLDLDVAAATGAHLPIQSLAFDDLAQPWEVAYAFQGGHVTQAEAAAEVNRGGGVYVTRFEPGRLRLDYAGRVDPLAPSASQPLARFGDWVALDGASAQLGQATLTVRLSWRAFASAPGDYTAFVHVVGARSEPLIQSDGYPIDGLLPPRLWRSGATIDDVRTLQVPADVSRQPLHVLVGLYDRAAPATRAMAVNGAGVRWPGDAVEIAVTGAS